MARRDSNDILFRAFIRAAGTSRKRESFWPDKMETAKGEWRTGFEGVDREYDNTSTSIILTRYVGGGIWGISSPPPRNQLRP